MLVKCLQGSSPRPEEKDARDLGVYSGKGKVGRYGRDQPRQTADSNGGSQRRGLMSVASCEI